MIPWDKIDDWIEDELATPTPGPTSVPQPTATPTPDFEEDPYEGVNFRLPDGPPRKYDYGMTPDMYDQYWVPTSFYKSHFNNWMTQGDQNLTAVYHNDYVDVDMTDTHWDGGVNHIKRELYYWNSDKTFNFFCIDFERNGRQIFRIYWDYAHRCHGVGTPQPTSQPAPTATPQLSNGNNPAVASPWDGKRWTEHTESHGGGRLASPGEFRGVVYCGNHDRCTDFRYKFRSHFEWNLNVKARGNEVGVVKIEFNQVPNDQQKYVRWYVIGDTPPEVPSE